MTTLANLSAETRNIITNLYNKLRGKSFFSDTDKQLMVSLYSTMPFADAKVLNILGNYKIALPDYISGEEIGLLQREYAGVISYCLYRIDVNPDGIVHSKPGILHLPLSLIELCMEMAGGTRGKSVYLPYAAEGSFALHCEGALVKGFEWNPEYWAISQILASTLPEHEDIEIHHSSELDHSTGSDVEKYDLVFSFPPMLNRKDSRAIVDTFHRIITTKLKDNGEIYAILPTSFCYESSGWFDVRKILLDYPEKYSVMVISLPPVLAPASNVPLCLVHFVNDDNGMICLADVSDLSFFSRHDQAGYNIFDLNVKSILETIEKQDENHVWVGRTKDLNSNLDLTPSRYLLAQNTPEKYEGHDTIRLRELIEVLPLEKNTTSSGDFPLLGMKELSFKHLNCDISYKDIPVKPVRNAKVLTKNALLAGFIGGKFKVGRINGLSTNKAVSLRNEVCAFRIVSKDITEDYLLRTLLSKFVEKQANALASGVTISRLSKEDLLDIRIPMPSVEEQENIRKEDTRESLTEADRKLLESFEEFREDMHMKKHAIGQTIFNLSNWWKALQKARKEGNGDVKDSATVGKSNPVSVSEIYDSLQETISQLQQQISKFDRGNGLEIKNFALTEFIEDYIIRKRSPLFTFVYNSESHHSINELRDYDFDEDTGVVTGGENVILEAGSPIEYVDFAPDALNIILDNIVSNACSHGFEGRDECVNLIRIDLTTEGDHCIVTVSNNGEPLHTQISEKDVFIYSRTSKNGKGHFGIGGYEVKKLMREFGGDAEFISDPDSEFPVTYRLIFHNTNIKSFDL